MLDRQHLNERHHIFFLTLNEAFSIIIIFNINGVFNDSFFFSVVFVIAYFETYPYCYLLYLSLDLLNPLVRQQSRQVVKTPPNNITATYITDQLQLGSDLRIAREKIFCIQNGSQIHSL